MNHRNLLIAFVPILFASFSAPASAQETGWRESPWFGSYYQAGPAPSWVFRDGFDWGYAYDDPSGSSAWFFVPGFGFVWSGEESWPWFYSTEADGWVFVDPDSRDPSYFYDSSAMRWRVGPTQFPSVSSLSAMSFSPVADMPEPFPLGSLYRITEDLRIDDMRLETFGGVQVRGLPAAESGNIRIGQNVQIRGFFDQPDLWPGAEVPTFLNFSRDGSTFSTGVGPDGDSLRVAAWTGGFEGLGRMPPARSEDGITAMDLYSGSFRDAGDYLIRFGFADDSAVFTPLQAVELRVNRARPSVLEGDVVADTGFRPNPDGMGFENFVDIRPSDLTEDDIRLLLGDLAVWPEPGGGTVLKATARMISGPLLDGMTGGHCFGIGIVGSRLFRDIPLSNGDVGVGEVDPTAEEAIDLQKFQLRRPISVDMARQFTSSRLTNEINATGADGPTAAFEQIRSIFEEGDTVPVIGLYERGGGGGHAITPYAITDQGGGVFFLHVWDNNFPDEDQLVIVIDTVADTWEMRYADPSRGTPYPEFEGDATTGSFNFLTWEMLADYEPEIVAGKVRIQTSEDNRIFVEAEDGRRIGYDFETGEVVRDFPGAEVLPVFDVNKSPNYLIPVDPGSETIPSVFDIDEIFDEMLEVLVGPEIDSGEAVDFGLYLTGTSFVSHIDGIALDAGEIFDFLFHPSGRIFAADGEEVPLSELSFEFAINDDPEEMGYLFEIEEIQVPEGSSILVWVNEEFRAEVIEIPEVGEPVLLPPDRFESSRQVVGVGFD
ncbi:MAG: hypothetical protein ACLFRP_00470 [Puniceicoccaceae bacterium]